MAIFFWEMTVVQTLLVSLFCFIILAATSFYDFGLKYNFLGIKNRSFLKTMFLMMPLFIFLQVLLFVSVLNGLYLYLVMLWIFSSECLATMNFKLRAYFHQSNFQSTVFQSYGYSLKSLCLLFFVYYVSFISERHMLYSSDVEMETKSRVYKFYVPFVSGISIDLFKYLEKELEFKDKIHLYNKLNFDPSTLGMSFFLDDSKEQMRLVVFLTYGKPNKEFLTNLLGHIEVNGEFWNEKNSRSEVLNLIFSRWPDKEKMPGILSNIKKERLLRVPAKLGR